MNEACVWMDMDPNAPEVLQDWTPNALQVLLSDACIDVVEDASAKGHGKHLLPDGCLRFFIVSDWDDGTSRLPGDFPVGGPRVQRDACADQFTRPSVSVTFKGLVFSAYFTEYRVWLETVAMPRAEFRAAMREARARELAGTMAQAMGGGEDLFGRVSAGPEVL